MNYTEERVFVREITKNGIYVLPLDECIDDKSCKGCNLCNVNSKEKQKFLRIKGDFKVGDTLKIKKYKLNEALAAFLIFGLPLIFLVTAYAFTSSVITDFNKRVVISLAAFIAGFFLVGIIDRVYTRIFPIRYTRLNDFGIKEYNE